MSHFPLLFVVLLIILPARPPPRRLIISLFIEISALASFRRLRLGLLVLLWLLVLVLCFSFYMKWRFFCAADQLSFSLTLFSGHFLNASASVLAALSTLLERVYRENHFQFHNQDLWAFNGRVCVEYVYIAHTSAASGTRLRRRSC